MNNKGFTLVEMLVSFILSMVIVVLLFQLIINLKDVYVSSFIKTELLNRQNLMTNKIYSDFIDKQVISISNCNSSSTCVDFTFFDGSDKQLIIDDVNNILSYDDYVVKLDNNSYFGSFSINTSNFGNISNKYNKIFNINVPILNDNFNDENFGINVVYMYDGNSVVNSAVDLSGLNETSYVQNGLIAQLDGIKNTSSGHSDSTTTWVDLSGNGNDATLYNDPIWGSDSIIFDGSNDYGRLENTANMGFPNGFTLETRVKALSPFQGDDYLNFFGNWEQKGFGLSFYNIGKFFSEMYVDGDWLSIEDDSISDFNKFYTITTTYNNSEYKLYVNGILVNTENVSNEIIDIVSAAPFGIGCNPSVSSVNSYSNVEFQNLLIYNRALTANEVNKNYIVDSLRY